ncbi:MAG: peptidase MA family metallohydrolase [Gemmatimonadota bacterium]
MSPRVASCLLLGLTGLAETPRAFGQGAASLPPVRFHAEAGLEPVAERLASGPGLRTALPAMPAFPEGMDPVDVWIVRDLATLADLGLGPAEDWVAGVADPSTNRIGLRAARGVGSAGELGPVLRHELAHVALAAVTGGRAPAWLDEGYAQYASGSWGYGDAWTLRLLLLRGERIGLRRVALGFRRGEAEARVAYLLSYTAVHSLFERGGEKGVAKLLSALGRGESLDAALRIALRTTEARFERQWREDVRARYGWLFVLSRASAFWLLAGLFLVAVVSLRRRRDRRRLAALDEVSAEPWTDSGDWLWDDEDEV